MRPETELRREVIKTVREVVRIRYAGPPGSTKLPELLGVLNFQDPQPLTPPVSTDLITLFNLKLPAHRHLYHALDKRATSLPTRTAEYFDTVEKANTQAMSND